MYLDFSTTTRPVFLIVFSFCLMVSVSGVVNHKERVYNGINTLNRVATAVFYKDFGTLYDPQVYNNKQKLQNLYSAVKAICPLLNNHKEIKEMSLIHNSTVEIQAADAVLDFVLNDTCNWIHSLKETSQFQCTVENLKDFKSLCTEIALQDVTQSVLGKMKTVCDDNMIDSKFTHQHTKQWISTTFFGKDSETVDKALNVLNLYRTCTKTSGGLGTSVTCN